MSTTKTKPQVRPEQTIKKINNMAQALGGRSARTDGLVGCYADTADLPDPTDLPNGILVFDADEGNLKISYSGSWLVVID